MTLTHARLAAYAKAYLGLDVATERNYILFINKRAQSLKLIGKRGQLNINLSLGLDHGSFQRIVQRVNEAAYLPGLHQGLPDYDEASPSVIAPLRGESPLFQGSSGLLSLG